MVAPSRLRPFTFFGRVPKGATNVDVVKALVQRESVSELKSVQDFGAGRFEVTFKTKAAVDRFSADPALKVRDVTIQFEYRGVRTKVVRVFGYPSDLPDQALSEGLQVFGKVLGISEECVPGFPSVGTGNRRIRMEMARPVPNLLRVGDRVIQCEYEGVARLCRRCNLEGHHAVACETPKCVRCEQFGHESCDAACVRCGGDHAVSSCPVRTYSSVASGSEPQPSASEPATTSVLGSTTVATENGDSQGSLSEGDSAGVDADSAAADALPSLSAAATSGGGSGEEVVAAPVVAPAAATVPAEAAELSGEPEPLASTSTEAPFIEVSRKKRKKNRSKRSGSAAREAASRRSSSDSEGSGSHSSEPGLPTPKRTAVVPSGSESEMEDSSGNEEDTPCEHCKGFDCDSAPAASSAAPSPKKKAVRAKPTASHPKVSAMVNASIGELKERGGSSLQAIKKHMAATYKVDVEKLSPFIRKYLKSAVTSGALVQTKGKGASGSFKLAAGAAAGEKKKAGGVKKTPKKAAKKPASAKKTPKKSPKKVAAKKAKPAKKPKAEKKASLPKKPKKPAAKKAATPKKAAKK
ncbi:hypothetical protein HPB49_005172 [Dermacentor silvarum]|uniref:Uncharacterized protein n=1 Tax=Dermacentor silvarum TaxID=543639 RepID=A0ACB8D2M8_DERSI|nr:hypothetical protein HPB49_005172 [Dermacentor silvarum]